MKSYPSIFIIMPASRRMTQVCRTVSIGVVGTLLCMTPTLEANKPPEEIIRKVDDATRLQQNFETRYEVFSYPPAPHREDGEVRDISPDTAAIIDRIRVVAHRGNVRQDLERIQDGHPPYVISHIWDGDRLWIHDQEEDIVEVHSTPPRSIDLHVYGHYFNRIESRYHGDWASAIAERADERDCELDEATDVLRCRTFRSLTSERFDGLSVEFNVHQPHDPAPELTSFIQRFSSRDPQRNLLNDESAMVIAWHVTAWDTFGEIGEIRMPATAELVITSVGNAEENERSVTRNHAHYRRDSFHELPDDAPEPEMFRPPLEPGVRVIDADLNFSFRVGERYLSYDGTLYLLREPLMEHPGERLPELIRTAEPQDTDQQFPWPDQSDNADMQRDSEQTEPPVGLVTAIIVAIGAGLLVFIAIRSVRGKGA